MSKPNLLIIPGSLRGVSSSRAVARTLSLRLADRADCTIADIGTLPHYNADITDAPEVDAFKAAVDAAQGVILITPEYNYSVPGLLKNALDWASRPAYQSVFRDKPCFVISVSGGVLGGVRAQGDLKYMLAGMLARVHVGKEVVIPKAPAKVEDGLLTDDTVLSFMDDELGPFLDTLG